MCGPTARPRARVRPSPRRRGRVLVDRARHAPSLSSPRCVPLDNISQETQQTKPHGQHTPAAEAKGATTAVRLPGSRATRTTAEGPRHSLAQGPLRRRPSRARPASSRAGKVHTAGPRLDPRKGLPAGPASAGVWEPGFREGAPRPRSLNDDGPLCINCSNSGLC